MHRAALSAVLCALLAASVSAAHAEWIVDGDGAMVYEDNLTRASRPADRKGDVAFVPALSLGHYFQLADATSLLATADVTGHLYTRYERLSHLSSTLTLAVRHKLGLGALAPWLRVAATGGGLDYGDDVRDSALAGAGVQAGKRLSDRVDVQAGYVYEVLEADHRVFDQHSHTVSLQAGVALSGTVLLTAGYAVRWGDLVIHKAPVPGAPPTPRSREVDTFDTPLVAARIDATTHVFALGLSYALSRRAALNAGYEYQISYGPQLSYPNTLLRAGLGYRF